MNAANSKRRIGLWIALAILSGFISALLVYSYVASHVRVVRLEEIFDPAYGFPLDYRERYFNRDFPAASTIKNYLHDATLLISRPPTGNRVYYFDKDQGFVSWRDNVIDSGVWWTSPEVQILYLGARWRVAVVQIFCMSRFGIPRGAQQDNCYSVGQLESLLAAGKGSRRDYREGNVFHLQADNPPPLQLPNSELSIALLSKLADKDH